MDFPDALQPSLFMTGPLGLSDIPDVSFMCSWRDALTLPGTQPQNSESRAPANFSRSLRWEPATPGPLPLLPPGPDPWDPGVTAQDILFRGDYKYRRQPRAVLDVTEQLSRFLWDHGDIAFAPLGRLMLENFKLEGARSQSKKKTVVSVKKLHQDLGGHQPWGCPWAYLSHRQRRFSILGGPVLGRSVVTLLGDTLQEELALRWEKLLLDDAFTGGALAWVPGRAAHAGHLFYPAGGTLDTLCFQEVSLNSGGDPQFLGTPGRIQLRGPVRQVMTRTVQGESLLAVRSDYHCALWKINKQGRPAPLQVLSVEKGATGISLSPHLPGELAVCSSSGAICLWTPQDGLQQVYKDPETLVFRDPSPWRWADFTCHPRVLTVGDRTGVKIIDTQGPPGCGLMLFRAGAEALCQKGERILLTQYLGEPDPKSLHPTLHLVCTQFAIYLMDERLPLVPMLKWSHDLPSAPLLAQLLPAPQSGFPSPFLLGGQGGHLQLLHITGDSTSVPRLAGPPQSLPSRSDSLSAFPLLNPKSHQRLQERLKAPTIGLTAVLPPSASTPTLSVFQLSAAGDVFYQCLHLQTDPGPTDDPRPDSCVQTASWSPHVTDHCSRWLNTLLDVAEVPPVWTAPTFSHRHLLNCKAQQRVKGTVTQSLRTAMARGQILRQKDLGSLSTTELPPAPESGPEDELTERLEAAWTGRLAAWWQKQQGQDSEPRRQPKRSKRRTQLSGTFSSHSGHLDFSDATSPPHSPDHTPCKTRPQLPATPPSQEVSQELCTRGIPAERQQTLRDYMAKLPLQEDNPEDVSIPPSQSSSFWASPSRKHTLRNYTAKLPLQRDSQGTSIMPLSQVSSIRSTRSSQQTPVLSGSQTCRKRARMGF